jgi:archaemetzincin
MRLAVLQVGSINAQTVQNVQRSLSERLPETTCTALEYVLPTPQEAYSSGRRQYNSTKILSRIRDYIRDLDFDCVLGVTDVDLYALGLNFVFGEAECPGRVAIVSLHRLRPEFYGLRFSRRLFIERCAKEAVHETGHTLGLSHCRDSSCVMFFSNSISDTDRKGTAFCSNCTESVVKRVKYV